jgi:sodium pump decarboxylase gamma subunit
MSNIMTGLTLTIVGMGVVITSLYMLSLVIKLIGLLLGRTKAAVPAAGGAVAAEIPAGDGADEELAALMAAVAVALSEPVRIHHIRMLQDEQQAAWSRIGRLDIMRSHSGSGRQG